MSTELVVVAPVLHRHRDERGTVVAAHTGRTPVGAERPRESPDDAGSSQAAAHRYRQSIRGRRVNHPRALEPSPIWLARKVQLPPPDDDPYNKEFMFKHNEDHNREVREYLKDRPADLLVLKPSQSGAYQKFVDFLGINSPYVDVLRENRT